MSTIRTNTLLAADGSTTTEPSIPALDQRMAKAWVFYNMFTATINGSYNVSSITDAGVGQFTINMTNALTNTTYTVVANSQNHSSNTNCADNIYQDFTTTTSAFSVQHVENNSTYDARICTAVVFGN